MSLVSQTLSRPATLDRRLLAGTIVLVALALLPMDWSWDWPKDWTAPVAQPITRGFKWLARDFAVGGVEFGVLVRSAARMVELPLLFMQGLLAKGLEVGRVSIPPLSWFSVLSASLLLAHWAGGWRLLVFLATTGIYLLVCGLWESAMLTMALVLIAVVIGVMVGTLLGVAAWKNQSVERALTPLYDLLQVLPIFSYLLPIIIFFGFGPLAALVATVVFAMPPMARITTLALRKLPQSAFELATIAGCREWQRFCLVLLPSARADLLVGVNQVVNLSFAVAVFSAIIGAGGLGNDLFAALKSLRLGPAMEAGIAITLLAIALDRIFRALALRRSSNDQRAKSSFWRRHPHAALTFGFVLGGYLLSLALPSFGAFPEAWTFSSGPFWNEAIASINAEAGASIGQFRDFLIVWLLRPVKDFLHAVPWIVWLALVATAALLLQGPRLAISLGGLLFVVVLTGYWAAAMTSLYLVLIGVALAILVGFPLGLAGALSSKLASVNDVLVDTIQTLPPFIYLVPSMMVLGIGDVPALASIVIYASAPAIRYSQSGLLQVRRSVMEAASMSGCSPWQRLVFVQLPIAIPNVMLGLNQTVVMGFGMLVVTALVGTRGLEASTLTALGKVDTGTGLVAGFGLVALTVVADRLLTAAGARLGLSTRHGSTSQANA